jgi:endoglucanase
LIFINVFLNCMTLRGRVLKHPMFVRIQNKQFVDEHGKQYIFKGVSKSGLEYLYPDLNAWTEDMMTLDLNNMKNWGVNIVRFPLRDIFWNSDETYRFIIGTFIEKALEKNFFVIIDLHTQQTHSEMDNFIIRGNESFAFWQGVANRYKNDTRIFFELFNEPHGIDASTWWYGDENYYGYKEILQEIRKTSNNICILGGLDYAYQWAFINDFPEILKDMLTFQNIAISSHPYGYRGKPSTNDKTRTEQIPHVIKLPSESEKTVGDCHLGITVPTVSDFGFQESFGFMKEHFPLILTEWGLDRPDTSIQGGWYVNNLVSYMNQNNMSYVAWAWIQDRLDYPSLLGHGFEPTGIAKSPNNGPACGTLDNDFYVGPGMTVFSDLKTHHGTSFANGVFLYSMTHSRTVLKRSFSPLVFFGSLSYFLVTSALDFLF